MSVGKTFIEKPTEVISVVRLLFLLSILPFSETGHSSSSVTLDASIIDYQLIYFILLVVTGNHTCLTVITAFV
jgi:hypothetical protein